ncbi:RNaseH domain-containing protein [Pseudomonas laurentiana]
MKNLDLRTSLFSFDPQALAHAYRAQIGEHYLAAWQVLQNLGKKHHPGLPTNALKEMLAAVSGGPVEVNLFPYKDKGASAILMLRPLPVDTINQILYLWSLEVMRMWDEQVEGLETKLAVTELHPLLPGDLINPDGVSPQAYTVVPWLVGQAMCSTPLESTQNGNPDPIPKLIPLQQASDGSLIAWNDPIVPAGDRNASALHVIKPALKLLRDCTEPFIQLRVKLSQIMPTSIGRKRHAWVHTGQSIVKAGIRSKKTETGWQTVYDFPTNKLLAFMGVQPLPDLIEGDIPVDSLVRPIYVTPPLTPAIGSGPGPLFLDQTCFHLIRSLRGSQPLLARKAVSSIRVAKTVKASTPVKVHAAVLAAHSEIMLRLVKASETLGTTMPFFKKNAPPEIQLTRLAVEGVTSMLEGSASSIELDGWLRKSVVPEIKKLGTSILIVETSTVAAALDSDRDPKHYIRRVLAEYGIVTQFIMHEVPDPNKPKPKKESRDYKALNTVTEAIRLTGYFPTAFVKAKTIPTGTTILSIRLDRINEKGDMIYLPVITRTVADTQKCEVYWFVKNDPSRGQWYPFTEGVAAIHATPSLINPEAINKLVTWSMLVATDEADTPLIVCLDSNLRTFYRGLKDSPDSGLPPVPANAAIVRVRVDNDIAQMSGNHSEHPTQPQYIGQKIGVFQSLRSPAVYYFVSPSKIYSKAEGQRKNTRYQVGDFLLADPWQQLGVTEITVIEPASFASSTAIAEQVALLCRNAPLWDGQLKLPSPMHLGAQIANDHPIMEMRRKSDANRLAEKA